VAGECRQLENAIERAAVLNEKAVLDREDFHVVSPSPRRGEGVRGEDVGDGTLRSCWSSPPNAAPSSML